MSTRRLLGRMVDLSVSDPWEFGTECGPGPFSGRVTDAAADALTARLELPPKLQGRELVAVVVRPRYTGESMDLLVRSRQLVANVLFLTRESSSLAGVHSVEHGVAAVGSVKIR